MIWLITGVVVAAIWLFVVILYVTGDLKRILCGHHSTTKMHAYCPEEKRYRLIAHKCENCGKDLMPQPIDASWPDGS